MVKGRSPRESNPLPGEKPGFVASHDTTGAEDYKRTSPLNPLPVRLMGDSNVNGKTEITNLPETQKVQDVEVKAELESIKATQQAILDKLDGTINTQITGRNVGYSTEAKPAGEKGESFIELDTKKVFLHDGSNWSEF